MSNQTDHLEPEETVVADEASTAEASAADDPVDAAKPAAEDREDSAEATDATATEEPVDAEIVEETEPEPAPEPEPEPLQLQLTRLRADFDNFRKRTQREKAVWSASAVERLVGDLLPVLDGFDLGLKAASESAGDNGPSDETKGFELIRDQLVGVLKKSGLRPIEAVGSTFDADLHEVISEMPSPDVAAEHVLFESRRGYCLGDKCIRPAQVVLSTGDPNAASTPAATDTPTDDATDEN